MAASGPAGTVLRRRAGPPGPPCHDDAMQEQDGREACGDDGQRRKARLLVAVERGKGEDLGGERVEVEGPQQKRRRQLLHRIDEDEQSGGAECRPQQRQMHPPGHLAHRGAERPGRCVDVAGDLAETRLHGPERGGKEADRIGEHQRKGGSRENEPGRQIEQRPHQGIDAVVEARQRDEQADGEHGAWHRIAEARHRTHGMDELGPRLPPRISEHDGEEDGECRGGRGQA
jgi:hypothetical protein